MDPGRGGGRPGDGGPGYEYYNPNGSSSTPGGSSNLPLWALLLIMLGSGLVTLIFLWLCVLFICRKRRARRAAVRDLEVETAWVSIDRDTARLNPPAVWEKDVDLSDARRCEADHVELTYVVMAGEDQPSFLARPAANITSSNPEAPPSSKGALISSPLTVVLEVEPVTVNPQKSPPSPS